MRKGSVVLAFLATLALRAEGWAFGGHAGVLLPGCGLNAGLHGEDWGVEAGLAAIRPLGPRAEGRLEAAFGGLAGHAPGPRSQVNADRPPMPLREDGFDWFPRSGGPIKPAASSVPGEGTGFRPTWGLGLGLGFGRHLEGEIRWEALVHQGRTLGAWQLRAGFRF